MERAKFVISVPHCERIKLDGNVACPASPPNIKQPGFLLADPSAVGRSLGLNL